MAEGKTCRDIIHPMDTNCWNMWLKMYMGTMKGSFKFFLIIYAMQCLIKKRCTKKYFKEQMIFFARSYIYGISMGTTFSVTICLTRRILGKFYYYTAVAVPGFFTGLPIFMENSSMKKLNTILFFNMALETVVRILRRDGVLIRSTKVDTAFFMLTNAVFMYLLSANQLARKATLIWFFNPRQSKTNTNQVVNGCCEKNQCRKHILQDSLKYFAFAYGFQAMKSLLPRILTLLRKPRQLVSALFNKKGFLFGSFIGSYVLIYKLVCRELFALKGRNEHSHHLLAGLLAGISYSFKPNLAIALMPATLILQVEWSSLITGVYQFLMNVWKGDARGNADAVTGGMQLICVHAVV
ncbi:uncharacterized protein CBL_12600 [Carabus blaptoides fortunei]